MTKEYQDSMNNQWTPEGLTPEQNKLFIEFYRSEGSPVIAYPWAGLVVRCFKYGFDNGSKQQILKDAKICETGLATIVSRECAKLIRNQVK